MVGLSPENDKDEVDEEDEDDVDPPFALVQSKPKGSGDYNEFYLHATLYVAI